MARLVWLALGGLLILLGVAMVPLPVPLAFVTIALGLTLVVANSISATNAVRRMRVKRPRLDAHLYRTTERMPRGLRRVLASTDPRQDGPTTGP